MKESLKNHAEKIRFLVIGAGNTVLDFALLFLLVALGADKIVANFLSTGASMVVSFFANKTFTFKNNSPNAKKQFALFISVTASGLWILQPTIIWLVTEALQKIVSSENVSLFVAKIIATVASLVWNYLFYSHIVFKKA